MRRYWILLELFVCEYVVFRNTSSLFSDYATKVPQAGYGFPQYFASAFFLLLFSWLFLDDFLRNEEKKIPDIEKVEHVSQWLLQAGIWSVISVSILDYFVFRWHKAAYIAPWLSVIGLILFGIAIYLHLMAGKILKPSYTDAIIIFKKQALITKNAYELVRHPMYASLTLMMFATTLIFESIIGFVLFSCLFLPSLFFRIYKEEYLLKEHFGKTYENYVKQTKLFVKNVI